MRLVQRARTSATPAQVWEVLGQPSRWPEFEPFLRRVLPRFVLYMGAASYSLYLFHSMLAPIAPVLLGAVGLRSGALSVICSVSGSIFAAALIYKFVELPITRRLRRLPYAGVPVAPAEKSSSERVPVAQSRS